MRVFTRAFFSGVFLAGLFLLGATSVSAKDKPNIVFIISDDHDNEHLGFLGSKTAQTPNLDRLADSGTVFPVSHLPMSRCHPTLASFLSGRWPHQSGIYYNYGAKKLSPRNTTPATKTDPRATKPGCA